MHIWGFRARAKAARLLRWLCQLSSGQHSDKSENEPTLGLQQASGFNYGLTVCGASGLGFHGNLEFKAEPV